MQTSHIGTSDIIFRYNGRDGVITDFNGLAYMRARYYSPNMRRFINADIIHGTISDSTSLNRYAYSKGNPVSFSDPFGLSAERVIIDDNSFSSFPTIYFNKDKFSDEYYISKTTIEALINKELLDALYQYAYSAVENTPRPNNIGKGIWAKQVKAELKWIDDIFGPGSKAAKFVDALGKAGVAVDVGVGVYENIQNGTDAKRIVTDAVVDAGVSVGSGWLVGLAGKGVAAAATKIGTATGTAIAPGLGTLIGAVVGVVAGVGIYYVTEVVEINGKSAVDWVKEGVDSATDAVVEEAPDIAILASSMNSFGGFGGGGGCFNLSCLIFGMK